MKTIKRKQLIVEQGLTTGHKGQRLRLHQCRALSCNCVIKRLHSTPTRWVKRALCGTQFPQLFLIILFFSFPLFLSLYLTSSLYNFVCVCANKCKCMYVLDLFCIWVCLHSTQSFLLYFRSVLFTRDRRLTIQNCDKK